MKKGICEQCKKEGAELVKVQVVSCLDRSTFRNMCFECAKHYTINVSKLNW